MGNGNRVIVTCSHITFVGKGKNQTTMRGGFYVYNQQNVTFEELTITNQSGNGIGLYLTGSETNVDVLKCIVKECDGTWVALKGSKSRRNRSCLVYSFNNRLVLLQLRRV